MVGGRILARKLVGGKGKGVGEQEEVEGKPVGVLDWGWGGRICAAGGEQEHGEVGEN
jgi:hypothetical protein